MKKILTTAWIKLKTLFERYPVIFVAIVIYLYYLATSVDFFRHASERRSFFDYVFQFDSLFFLWLAAMTYIQLQKTRKVLMEKKDREREMEHLLERQQFSHQLITDVTRILKDNVNNPLAVIALTNQEIRKKFVKDTEISQWLDRIEHALNRIHNTIHDLETYEANKLLDATAKTFGGAIKE